jgi:hypothetical protein
MSNAVRESAIVRDPAAARLLREVNDLDHRLENASEEEISFACDVLTLTAAKLIGLRARKHVGSDADIDRTLQEQLRRASEDSTQPMVTEESARRGDAIMTQARADAAVQLKKKIARGELVSSKEMQDRLHVSRQSISRAVNEGRLFAIVGPAGANYYPAFYADPKHDRRLVEQVIRQLGTLPPTVKYHFFTSQSFSLNGKTPLEALQEGQLEQVLRVATSHVER